MWVRLSSDWLLFTSYICLHRKRKSLDSNRVALSISLIHSELFIAIVVCMFTTPVAAMCLTLCSLAVARTLAGKGGKGGK